MKVSITSLLRHQRYAAIVIIVLVVLSIVGIWNFISGPTKEIIDIEEKIQETVTLTPLENITIALSPFRYESHKEFWEYKWVGLEEFLLNRTISIEISTKNNVYICLNYSLTCGEMFKGNYYRAMFVPIDSWETYFLTIINTNENNTAKIRIIESYKVVKLIYEYAFIWFYIGITSIFLVLIIQYLSNLTVDDLKAKILAKLFSRYILESQQSRLIHTLMLFLFIFLTISTVIVALRYGILDILKMPTLILGNLALDLLYRMYTTAIIFIIIIVLSLKIATIIHRIFTYPIAKKFYTVEEFRDFKVKFESLYLKTFKNFQALLILIGLFIILGYVYLYSKWDFTLLSIITSLLLGPYFGFLHSWSYLRAQAQKHLNYFRYIKLGASSFVIFFLIFTQILNGFIYCLLPIFDQILNISVISLIEEAVGVFPTIFDFLNLVSKFNIFFVLGSLPLISFYYFFLIFTIFLALRSSVSANEGTYINKNILKYELKHLFMDDLINDFVFPALIFLVSIWLQYYITGPLEWGDVAVSFLISFIAGFFANYLQGLRQGQGCRE